MIGRKTARGKAVTFVAVLVVASLTAFGTSDAFSSNQAARTAAAANVKEAKKLSTLYMAGCTVNSNGGKCVTGPLTVPALPKKPPTGKKLAVISCALLVCDTITSGAISGGHALGWKVTRFASQLSPEAYLTTWTQVMQSNPDAIIYVSIFPDSAIKADLIQAHSKKIQVINMSPNSGPPLLSLISGVTDPVAEYFNTGQVAADAVLADAGAPVASAAVDDPSLDPQGNFRRGFASEMGRLCPTCQVIHEPINFSNPPTVTDGQLVNFVQSNPQVKYLWFSLSDATQGLAAALAAAGLSKQVKIITASPDLQTLSNVGDGAEWATVENNLAEGGWQGVDIAARGFMHLPVANKAGVLGFHRILTKNTVVPGNLPLAPGVPSAYLKAWHVK